MSAVRTRPSESVPTPPASGVVVKRERWKRLHPTQARTVNMSKLPKRELELERVRLAVLEEIDPLGPIERPKTRGDCIDGARPCPHVGCRHHLFLEVTEKGNIKIRFPGREVWELEETCALDVAARGGLSDIEVGDLLNLTRAAVSKDERSVREKLRESVALRELWEHDPRKR